MLNSIMKQTVIWTLAVFAVILLCAQSHASPAQETRMNVLLLIVDDLNTWLLGDTNRYAGRVVAPNINLIGQIGNSRYANAIRTLRSAVPALSDMAQPVPSKKRKNK